MRKFGIVMIIFGIVLGCSFNASAQFMPLVREFTAFGGMTFNSKDDATAGAALALNISPRMGVEGELGAILAKDTVFNGSMNLIMNLGSGTSVVVPYLIGGAGVMTNGGTDIALNVGGGLKLFIEYNMALRVDFRGFFISEDGNIKDMERAYAGLILFF